LNFVNDVFRYKCKRSGCDAFGIVHKENYDFKLSYDSNYNRTMFYIDSELTCSIQDEESVKVSHLKCSRRAAFVVRRFYAPGRIS